MKRLLERTTFMIIGALIASVAYFIGNTNHGAKAESGIKIFDKINCNEITVNGRILCHELGVSAKEFDGGIILKFKNGNPHLEIATTAPKGGFISMQATESAAAITITSNNRPTGFDHVGVLVGSGPNDSAITVEGQKIAHETR